MDREKFTQEVLKSENTMYHIAKGMLKSCLLYTSDAADEEDSGDLGGSRIIKKKKTNRVGGET